MELFGQKRKKKKKEENCTDKRDQKLSKIPLRAKGLWNKREREPDRLARRGGGKGDRKDTGVKGWKKGPWKWCRLPCRTEKVVGGGAQKKKKKKE